LGYLKGSGLVGLRLRNGSRSRLLELKPTSRISLLRPKVGCKRGPQRMKLEKEACDRIENDVYGDPSPLAR
jgi:hypothetical protein